ncbi:unnamed protein product, partial [Polarella glacialis]
LNVEDNPHGEQGLRCLVRILARGRKDRRVAAGFEDLRLGEIRRSGENLGCVSYSYADPTAAYSLKLDHPQHRSVLRLLLKRAEEVCGGGGKEFGCFQEETLDGKPASVQALCQKQRNSGGDTWLVPTSGTLNLTFKLALACNPKDGVDAAIRSHSRRMRIPVSLKSFSRLWQVYTSLPSCTSQELFLRAVSWDLSFKLPQVKILAGHSRELYAEAVTRLLGAIEEPLSCRRQLFELLRSVKRCGAAVQASQAEAICSSLLYFSHLCILVSTWRRALSASDFELWNCRSICVAQELVDCSQYGNHESLRNTIFGRQQIVFVWDEAARGKVDEKSRTSDFALHFIAKAFVLLYSRTLYHSEVISPQLLYDPLLFSEGDCNQIRHSLGWIHSCDLLNLHSEESNGGNRLGPFNMEAYDGWLIVKLMIAIGQAEKSLGAFNNSSWSDKNGFVIPASWVPDPPRQGEFSTTFKTRTEDVNLEKRKELAARYLGWTFR